MKVTRSFRIEKSLSEVLDANCLRHGDVTYHIESALKAYFSKKPKIETEEKIKKVAKSSFTVDDYRLAAWMLDEILKDIPAFKRPNLERWADVVRLMRERDSRNNREMAELWRWVRKDSFWSSNILSPAKLREKYDQLYSQSKRVLIDRPLSTRDTTLEQELTDRSWAD